MSRILTKTICIFLATATAVVLLYFYVDKPVSEAAFTLKSTGWHTLANRISLAASSNFITLLLALGFLFGGCDALRNGMSDRAKHILYVCACVSAAIMMGDVLKDVFGRARPPLLFKQDIYGFFPLTGEYMYFSFPSGHTIRIFSSMTALGLALPQVRIPALLLAVLVGVSRVFALKHYPSDVLFGAFIGITVAVLGWKILYPYGARKTR